MMIWIHPVLNLLLWGFCILGALGIIYFLAPQFGGWKVLDKTGKICAILSLVLFFVVGFVLITTSVIPL
jgi:hypothetical protein